MIHRWGRRTLPAAGVIVGLLVVSSAGPAAARPASGPRVVRARLQWSPEPRVLAAIRQGGRHADALGVHQFVTVIDRRTGRVTDGPGAEHRTLAMSTIKLLIAAEVYYVDGPHLHGSTARLMHAMITISDNRAATTLYDRFGGRPMLDRVVARYRLHHTRSASTWGGSSTCAQDLAVLLADVDKDPRIGPPLFHQMSQLKRWAPGPVFAGYGVGALTGPHGAKQGYGYAADGSLRIHSAGFAGPRIIVVLSETAHDNLGNAYATSTFTAQAVHAA